MATGTVKWFDDEKGFGFIAPDDQSKDLFVVEPLDGSCCHKAFPPKGCGRREGATCSTNGRWYC